MSNDALEVIREQSKAEKQEKLTVIAPLVKRLQLRNPEVDALLKLPKKNLKALNKKVEDRLNAKTHQITAIQDPAKPAKLLWSIAKAACPGGQKVNMNQRYTVSLHGAQIMGCFAMAKSLYGLAEEKSADSLSTGSNDKEE
jgi:hypothetical protein